MIIYPHKNGRELLRFQTKLLHQKHYPKNRFSKMKNQDLVKWVIGNDFYLAYRLLRVVHVGCLNE